MRTPPLSVMALSFVVVSAAPRITLAAIGDIGPPAYGCTSIGTSGGNHVLNFDQGFGANVGETAIIVGATDGALVRGTAFDSTGMNTWTLDTFFTPGSSVFLISSRITTAIPSGGSVTLPYTNPTGSAKQSCITVVVFSGLWKSGAYLDQTGSAQGGVNPVSVSTNASIAQPEELVLASLGAATGFASFVNTMTTSTRNPAVGSNFEEIPIFMITSSTGVKTVGGSFSPSSMVPWATALGSYRGCGTDPVAPAVSVPGAVTVTQTTCQ